MLSAKLFLTVFGVIFVAELPDKTALAAVVLATRYRALPVFLGTALALTVQSAIAVAAGSLLSTLPKRLLHLGAGIIFIACGVIMWLRKPESDGSKSAAAPQSFARSFGATFLVVFAAEWGDLTQIGTATFQAQYHDWATVFLASTAALWCVAAIAVFVGNHAARWLNPRLTQKIAAIVFAIIGVLFSTGVV